MRREHASPLLAQSWQTNSTRWPANDSNLLRFQLASRRVHGGNADDVPAIASVTTPAWTTKLFTATKSGIDSIGLCGHLTDAGMKKNKYGSVLELPLYMIDVTRMPHNGNYPLEGQRSIL